jgi:predicted nucleic acid-binding protein
MKRYAIDTNILVYAHNVRASRHREAKAFIERVMNERDAEGNLSICIPMQVLIEFISAITSQRVEKPLAIAQATSVIKKYLDSDISILIQRETYSQNFMKLMELTTARRKIFDVALAAVLKDYEIQGLYTVNVSDFASFDFLEIMNPLEP